MPKKSSIAPAHVSFTGTAATFVFACGGISSPAGFAALSETNFFAPARAGLWLIVGGAAKARPAKPNIATIVVNAIHGRQLVLLTFSDMNAPSRPVC
jgi:hypothetical protein